MQKFSVDISSRGAPMVLYAAQGDTKSRFFSVAVFDSGVAYSLPIGAYVTVRFGAPGMPAGWYDIIQEPGGGSHPAVSVDGNIITAELAEQAVSVPGKNGVWLLVNTADGYQLASWGFDLFVEAVHGMDAPEATVYYNALAEQVSQTIANAQAASESASQAQQYAESINPAQFATAAQGALADSAVQSVNGQRGTAVTLTPAIIGAADASDVLTLEEIQASTDLTGKIASASALKLINTYFDYNINQVPTVNVYREGFRLYNSDPGVDGNPTSDEYYLVLSFTTVDDANYGIQIACAYSNHIAYIRRRWGTWGPWKQISN